MVDEWAGETVSHLDAAMAVASVVQTGKQKDRQVAGMRAPKKGVLTGDSTAEVKVKTMECWWAATMALMREILLVVWMGFETVALKDLKWEDFLAGWKVH